MHVDLDHAGVGGDLDQADARVEGRLVALDLHGQVQAGGGRLDVADQLQVLVGPLGRGHEDVHHPVPRLDGEGGAHGHTRDAPPVDGARAGTALRQGLAVLQRVLGLVVGIVLGGHVRQGGERQAEAEGRIARHQEGVAAPELPGFRDPDPVGIAVLAGGQGGERQDVAHGFAQAPLVDAGHARVELDGAALGLHRGDVDGEFGRLFVPVRRVLVGRHHVGGQAQAPGERLGEGLRPPDVGRARRALRRDQAGVAPDRLAVLAPEQGEGPAR
ncbi:hypothetical protein MPOCJGCO_0249 [Methylobacterium trifolii]|uniref:Uncharacterized protein n=1 Tax=Methylobacterium trifolii TaxID=1003092 RepID=A0ABQ4TWB7_9HYPH|nr:hypothetical protein MPOCJGCO_0249 [Methylobacterium trifolii]